MKLGDYSGVPDLITWVLQSRKLSPAAKERRARESRSVRSTQCTIAGFVDGKGQLGRDASSLKA